MDFVSSSPTDTVPGGGRIVVAESHPVLSGALSWLLREQGDCVSAVGNREALLADIAQVTPDVILLDGDVVQQDTALIEQIRADQRWSDVRVIVSAPSNALDEGVAPLPWGVDDCVGKPFRVPEVLGRVRTQLRASGQLRA